jgi:hypothetical protein
VTIARNDHAARRNLLAARQRLRAAAELRLENAASGKPGHPAHGRDASFAIEAW